MRSRINGFWVSKEAKALHLKQCAEFGHSVSEGMRRAMAAWLDGDSWEQFHDRALKNSEYLTITGYVRSM